MRKFHEHLRSAILSGILFFLPIFFLLGLIQKVWQGLTGFGAKIAGLVDLISIAGVGAATLVITSCASLFFIVAVYLYGLLLSKNSETGSKIPCFNTYPVI